MKQLIITEDFKNVLKKINSDIASILLNEAIDESLLHHPDKVLNYIDLSHTTKGHISYLTQDRIDKIQIEDQDFWCVKKRYHSRPGSFLKKLLKMRDYEIENFTTQFLSIVDPPVYNMVVVKGQDIAKYYDYHTYYQQSGALGGSCMKCSPPEFFQIYVENPNQINMLLMMDQHEKVMGRAILWVGEGFKILDRVYVCNDLYVNYFYNWANENGCYYKELNNAFSPKHMMFNGEKVLKEFEIKLDEVRTFDRFPYLDTFKWLDLSAKKIYNYIPFKVGSEYMNTFICISDHMGGYHIPNYFGFCDIDNDVHMTEEIWHLDYINKNVYNGKCVHSYTLDRHIYRDHSIVCNEIRDHIFNEEYDKFNDYKLIEAKKKEYAEKIKRGEKLKSGGYGKSTYGSTAYDDFFLEYEPYVPRYGRGGAADVTENEIDHEERILEQEQAIGRAVREVREVREPFMQPLNRLEDAPREDRVLNQSEHENEVDGRFDRVVERAERESGGPTIMNLEEFSMSDYSIITNTPLGITFKADRWEDFNEEEIKKITEINEEDTYPGEISPRVFCKATAESITNKAREITKGIGDIWEKLWE